MLTAFAVNNRNTIPRAGYPGMHNSGEGESRLWGVYSIAYMRRIVAPPYIKVGSGARGIPDLGFPLRRKWDFQ